jgi:hypothetical protein
MVKPLKNEKTANSVQKKSSPKGQTAKQIVKRHIRDKSDIIKEDDMKNVEIDSSLPTDYAHQPLPITNDDERPKDEDKDHKIETPWNVISG